MKKAVFFLLTIVVLLTSCGNGNKKDVTVSYDCDRNFQQYLLPYICSDNNTLFFSFADVQRLMYYDKDSGYANLLCGKPECTHSDSDCNAHFTGTNISHYGGKLYWLDGAKNSYAIYCSNIDRTNRKRILEFNDNLFGKMLSGGVGNLRYTFHRGYFYSSGTYHEIVDGVICDCAQVFAYPLDSENEGRMIYESIDLTNVIIQPYKDYLYFISYNESAFEICRYSAENDEVKVLYKGDLPLLSPKLWVTDDGMMISDDSGLVSVYKLDFENNELNKLLNFNSNTDEKYMIYGLGDNLIIAGYDSGNAFELYIKDFDGNSVLQKAVTIPGVSEHELLTTFPCGADDDNLYLWSKVWSSEHDIQFIIAVPFNGSKDDVIWIEEK